ncbi:MAG: hypothetical protein KDD66_17735 [Bdellovibrionales bacterium]|nr:hypothetical protein [Bdellovibrionales bacterium]
MTEIDSNFAGKGEQHSEPHSFFYRFTCKYYTEKAIEREDSPLSVTDSLFFGLHHVICTFCRRFARQQKAIRKGIESIFLDQESDKLPESARNQIRASLDSKLTNGSVEK